MNRNQTRTHYCSPGPRVTLIHDSYFWALIQTLSVKRHKRVQKSMESRVALQSYTTLWSSKGRWSFPQRFPASPLPGSRICMRGCIWWVCTGCSKMDKHNRGISRRLILCNSFSDSFISLSVLFIFDLSLGELHYASKQVQSQSLVASSLPTCAITHSSLRLMNASIIRF